MNTRLQMLRQELRSDLDSFVGRAQELESLALTSASTDPNLLARAAVALHHAYGAIEASFTRLAKILQTEPSGTNWHRGLLESMAMEVPGVRPAVIGAATLAGLRDLLAFRHFFRHAYSVALDAARLAVLRQRVIEVRPLIVAEFGRLDLWLAALADRS